MSRSSFRPQLKRAIDRRGRKELRPLFHMKILHVIPGLTLERGGPTAVVCALVRHQLEAGDRADDRQQHVDRDARRQQRDREVAERAPRRGAVDHAGFVHVGRDVLHAGQEDHHAEAEVRPDLHPDYRVQGGRGVAQQIGTNPELAQDQGDRSAQRVEHDVPGQPIDGCPEHHRQEDQRADRDLATQTRVQQPGDEHRHAVLDHRHQQRKDHRDLERADQEGLAAREEIVVVLQADPVDRGVWQARIVGQREDRRAECRNDLEHDEHG